MPNIKRSSAQVKRDKSAIKKLQSLGLLQNRKIDLRQRPSGFVADALQEFRDVLQGKATVVRPKNPAKFKDIFRVSGDAVIIPRRKGEKISVDKKTGEVVSVRKVGTRTVRTRGRSIARGQQIPPPTDGKRTQYAIPFKAPGGGTRWMRFPSYQDLQKFMAGYDYKGWQDYVVEEDIDKEKTDAQLTAIIEKLLGTKKRAANRRVAKKKAAAKARKK